MQSRALYVETRVICRAAHLRAAVEPHHGRVSTAASTNERERKRERE